MRLGDMLHVLAFEFSLEIRGKDNIEICTCGTNSRGIDPYVNYDIVEWFPDTLRKCIVVLIDLEDTDE